MNNFDVDLDVQSVDQRLRSLARELPVDSAHKQLLRNQLLRRHGELLTKSHSGGPAKVNSQSSAALMAQPAGPRRTSRFHGL